MKTELSKKEIVEVVMMHFEAAKAKCQEMDKCKCEGQEVHPIDYDRACNSYLTLSVLVTDLWIVEGGEN